MTDKQKLDKLREEVIDDLLWMAARYAHGRSTYAPSSVREAVKTIKYIWPDYEVKQDRIIAPPSEDLFGISFKEDYLDDIFNKDGR